MLWVHGFRQRYFRVVSVAHHLLKRFRDADAADAGPVVMPFLWPCHEHGLAYALARAEAQRSAPRLAATLAALRRARAGRVAVVAHSLGCRTALAALSGGGAGAAGCDHLVLLGGAVAADALADGGEFARGRVRARRVSVLHSDHDEVLRSYFALGEASALAGGGGGAAKAAIGLVGPARPLAAGVDAADVTATVPCHNPNAWLLSEEVMLRVREAAAAPARPEPAEGARPPV